VLFLAMAIAGCRSSAAASSEYAVAVVVEGDPGAPVASATVVRDGVPIGITGADGGTTVRLVGDEGQFASLTVRCPPQFTSPAAPLRVPLRRLADPSRVPSYRVACPPQARAVVVAVRATHGPDLPVFYLGNEVARTDASGAAHVLLHLPPGERFELMIGTDEKGAERLIPRDPVAEFVVKDSDELLFFDQRFDVDKPKARVGPRVSSGPKQF
jgi:hypothetical protein